MSLVLGIGTNLDNRLKNIETALTMLEQKIFSSELEFSSIYETQALLKPGSPKEWDIKFLNLVVKGKTDLKAQEVLAEIKDIETKMGRDFKEIWAPRIIDIDIIAYDDAIIVEKNLLVPHINMLNRKWVVVPFAEIEPDWIYPVQGDYYQKTIRELSELINFPDEYFVKSEYQIGRVCA
jgi:2-amino-4-hydroxy-6-hydroxymethyldihydropteridine diphosphokinase/dihydropteroate synthase